MDMRLLRALAAGDTPVRTSVPRPSHGHAARRSHPSFIYAHVDCASLRPISPSNLTLNPEPSTHPHPTLTADPPPTHTPFAQVDVLIASDSSFSMVPALLGNMTVLLPACINRYPLPHWIALPCSGPNASQARAAAAARLRLNPLPPTSPRNCAPPPCESPMVCLPRCSLFASQVVEDAIDRMRWPPRRNRLFRHFSSDKENVSSRWKRLGPRGYSVIN